RPEGRAQRIARVKDLLARAARATRAARRTGTDTVERIASELADDHRSRGGGGQLLTPPAGGGAEPPGPRGRNSKARHAPFSSEPKPERPAARLQAASICDDLALCSCRSAALHATNVRLIRLPMFEIHRAGTNGPCMRTGSPKSISNSATTPSCSTWSVPCRAS